MKQKVKNRHYTKVREFTLLEWFDEWKGREWVIEGHKEEGIKKKISYREYSAVKEVFQIEAVA